MLGALVALLAMRASAAPTRVIAYGLSGGLVAMELPSKRRVGQAEVGGISQGFAFALSPDASRGYLLDRTWLEDRGIAQWRLTELAVPALQVLRRTPVPDAINLLGTAPVVAVSFDGKQVYVETMRVVGPNQWDARLRVGQPASDYGIAIYDVAQGALTGEIRLTSPWCGVANLSALPDGRLAVFCSTSDDVRLVDPREGKQTASVSVNGIAGIAAPDGRRFWVVDESGGLHEIDLVRLAETREVDLSPGRADGWVPYQELHLTVDGKRLFVPAAPGRFDLRASGNASVVWVVDTDTFQRIAEVPLPAPAFQLAPTPDGGMLIAMTDNVEDRTQFGTRLVEVPSGRQVAYWSDLFNPLVVR